MTLDPQLTKLFFAYRNGVVADRLRRAGDPHSVIMGCTLAELANIARTMTPDATLACTLWQHTNHRECRLMATMLMPPAQFDAEEAMDWCHSLRSIEEADVLCHRLLRQTACAPSLWRTLWDDELPMARYAGCRLLMNLLRSGRATMTDDIRALVAAKLDALSGDDAPLRPLLTDLLTN